MKYNTVKELEMVVRDAVLAPLLKQSPVGLDDLGLFGMEWNDARPTGTHNFEQQRANREGSWTITAHYDDNNRFTVGTYTPYNKTLVMNPPVGQGQSLISKVVHRVLTEYIAGIREQVESSSTTSEAAEILDSLPSFARGE